MSNKHHKHTKHTIDILEHFYKKLPPLVPRKVVLEVEEMLEKMRKNYKITSEEAEDIIISLGKKVWPYWRAFIKLYQVYRKNFGEKILLVKLSPAVRTKYNFLREHGATYEDLFRGGPAEHFTVDERRALTESLLEVEDDIRRHCTQAVLSVEKKKYEKLIAEFSVKLEKIEKQLQTLSLMAKNETKHPRLAKEIEAQVKAYEFGLCLLGPNMFECELDNAEEFFADRKEEKRLHRAE